MHAWIDLVYETVARERALVAVFANDVELLDELAVRTERWLA
jgi:hypothetical protein